MWLLKLQRRNGPDFLEIIFNLDSCQELDGKDGLWTTNGPVLESGFLPISGSRSGKSERQERIVGSMVGAANNLLVLTVKSSEVRH
ncbi:hypothetical protein KM043_004042 [Ampulex compressa]|nr:hypothetical protein KM043_004042 [Ampulex compressa]